MSTRISDLPAAPTVNSVDLVPIVQGGITKKATAGTVVSNLLPVASTSQQGIVQLGTGAGNACQGNDARLSDSRTPSGSAGGDLTGTYPNPELTALGTAGTYGSSSAIPVLTVDAKGRVASISTEQIFVNADNITSGTLSPTRLANSGASGGTYGSSTQIPVLTIDAKGRIISAATAAPLPGNNASDLTTGTLNPNLLATSGVSAGTFGSSVSVGQFTVDSKGRITSATEIGISGSAGGTVVAVGATSNTLAVSSSPVIYSGALQIDLATTGVPALTAGSSTQSAVITVDTYGRITALETQAIAALSPTGVTAGTYGASGSVGVLAVNANGVITGATQQVISIGASQVLAGLTSAQVTGISASQVSPGITTSQISGLAPSATTDTTNASNITSGLLSASRLPNSGVVASTYGSSAAIPVLSIDLSGRITSASIAPITSIPTTVGYLKEITSLVATAAAGVINLDILTQPTLFYTASSTAAFTLNIRASSLETFNNVVSTGQSVTVTFLNTNGSFAAPLSALTIDGVTQSVKWQNGTGSIPTPSSNSIDAWTITAIKTAENTYIVIGSLTKFA